MRAALVFFPITVVFLVARSEQSLASFSSNHVEIRTTSSVQSVLDVDTLIQDSLDHLSAKIKEFQKDAGRFHRPYVTLAFSQSIDGMIALKTNEPGSTATSTKSTSSNFAISGPESLRLTHGLRSIHDGIIVGGKTLSVDNPRLTNRLWSPSLHKEPCVPIILDTHLNHIRLLGNKMRVQNPIVCCSSDAYEQARRDGYSGPKEGDQTVAAIKENDIPQSLTLLPCKTKIVRENDNEAKKVLDLKDVLSKLYHEQGINSLMVEGGASVLSLFAADTSRDEDNDENEDNEKQYLFDYLCVTISPKLLGSNGLASLSSFGGSSKDIAVLGPLKCISIGEDCVLFADRMMSGLAAKDGHAN